MQTVGATARGLAGPVTAANGASASLVTTLGRAGNASTALSGAMGGTAGSARQLAQTVSAANNNTGGLTRAFGTLNASTGALSNTLGRFSGVLGDLALAGATAGVLALAGAVSYAGKAASDFQDQVAQISTLVDTSTFSMATLTDGLKKQAVAFGENPIEQAKAGYEIVSSGATSAADALATLTAANKLAIAGNSTAMVAADGLTSSINSYGASVLNAEDATNSMFVTTNLGKISMEELSGQLGNVTPLASVLGVTFDELGASIAAMTAGGVKGSVAITNIRSALSAIIKPSSEAGKLAKTLGLDFSAAGLRAKGWTGFLQEMKEKTGGSETALATLLGSQEAMSAVLALTTTASAKYSESLDAMAKKAGAADLAVKKMMDTSPGFQAKRAWAAVSVEAINLGNVVATSLLPMMRGLADHLGDVVSVSKVLLVSFAAYKAVSFATTIMSGATALGVLGRAAGLLNTVIGVATKAQAVFNAVVLMNPYAAAAAAIIAVVGLLYQFSDVIGIGGGTMASFGDLCAEVWDEFKAATVGAYDAVAGAFSSIGSAVSGVMTAVAGYFSTTFDGFDFSIAGAIRAAARWADFLAGSTRMVWEIVKVIWSNFPEYMKFVFASAANRAIEQLEALGNKSRDLLNGIIGGINSAFGSSISLVPVVKLGRVDVGGFQEKLATATSTAFGTKAQDAAEKFLGRVSARGKTRRGAAAAATNTATDTGGGGGGVPDPDKKDKDKANKDAENRAKREAEFWATLQGELETSKAFGLAQDQISKELELQKIVGRDITKDEKTRVDDLVAQIATQKTLTGIAQKTFELTNENNLNAQRGVGLTEAQKAVEDTLFAARLDAQNKGVVVTTDAYRLAESEWKKQLDINQTWRDRQGLIKSANDLVGKYSPTAERAAKVGGLQTDLRNLDKQYSAGTLTSMDADGQIKATSAQIYAETRANIVKAIKEANDEGKIAWTDALDRIAQNFSGDIGNTLGKIVTGFKSIAATVAGKGATNGGLLGGIADLLGANSSKGFSKGAEAFTGDKVLSGLTDPMKSMSDGFASFKGLFSAKGPGSFASSLGSALGAAQGGMEIGSMVGGLTKALGIKTSQTGSKLGGAAGGLVGGPIGSIVGSLAGGIIGGLFKKSKQASAGFELDDSGKIQAVKATGKGSKEIEVAQQLADSVASSLNGIAERLGGTITGAGGVSIGYRPGHSAGAYRVDTTGAGKLTGVQAFEDAADAIAFAIKDALADGAITGLSDLAKKALNAIDIDSAVSLVEAFTKIKDAMDSINDPIGSAVLTVNRDLDSLIAQMNKVGASSADLATVETYRSKQLADILTNAKSTLTDFKTDTLMGDGSGVTKVQQLAAKMAELEGFRANIANGTAIDQDKFTAVGQAILALDRDLYGSSSTKTQAAYADLTALTNAALANVDKQYATATDSTTLITAGIQAQTQQAAIQTDYLAQIAASNASIADSLANSGNISPAVLAKLSGSSGFGTVNGYARAAVV